MATKTTDIPATTTASSAELKKQLQEIDAQITALDQSGTTLRAEKDGGLVHHAHALRDEAARARLTVVNEQLAHQDLERQDLETVRAQLREQLPLAQARDRGVLVEREVAAAREAAAGAQLAGDELIAALQADGRIRGHVKRLGRELERVALARRRIGGPGEDEDLVTIDVPDLELVAQRVLKALKLPALRTTDDLRALQMGAESAELAAFWRGRDLGLREAATGEKVTQFVPGARV